MFKPIITAVSLAISSILRCIFLLFLLYQLLERGHKVTAITNYQFETESKNYRAVVIDPAWDWSNFNMTQVIDSATAKENTFQKLLSIWKYGILTTSHALDSPVIKDFIKNDRSKFDLVISEQFYQEAFNMFAVKYNCPLIVIGTLDYSDNIDRARGAMTPVSHVPHFFSYISDKMSFMDRFENMIYALFDAAGRKFYYLPKQTELARKAFESLENERGGRLPSAEDLEKTISLHLMNSHLALSYPRPKMPGMVDIAGIHIKPIKPLPSDIQKFLDLAEHGAIYMSFGSFLQASQMSPEKYKMIIDVFRKLKMRVIWKWESEKAENLPPNVMIRKWTPQADILAHKNVKLFISHGGIFGSQEAIYHGVPLIVLPFYGDQSLNGQRMMQRGIAVMESMGNLTGARLEAAIHKIVNDKSYYENIQKVSEVFRTNQNPPLETAIWWIEYIVKFNGAPHLQSHSRFLSTFRYLSLDIFFVIFSVFYLLYELVKKIYDALKSKKDETKSDEKEKVSKKKKN